MNVEDLRLLAQAAEQVAEAVRPAYQTVAFQCAFAALLAPAQAQSAPPPRPLTAPRPLLLDQPVNVYLAALQGNDSHPRRVLALAYYHGKRHDAGGTSFHLRDYYLACRQHQPHNMPDVIKGLVRRGLLIEGPKHRQAEGVVWKSWLVTSLGEQLLCGALAA